MQHQVDDLIEASMPDHILYFLNRYQKSLLQELPMTKHYEFVCEALHRGRALGLDSMGDLVNYICAELFYGKKMCDPEICHALEQVRLKRKSLTAAFMEFS
jgi:hypothetical protein